jgi:uncharacterized protein (TIGR02145 family)
MTAEEGCAKYGRLYDWQAAMNVGKNSYSKPSGVQGICPVGWHLPGQAEWSTFIRFLDSGIMYDNVVIASSAAASSFGGGAKRQRRLHRVVGPSFLVGLGVRLGLAFWHTQS